VDAFGYKPIWRDERTRDGGRANALADLRQRMKGEDGLRALTELSVLSTAAKGSASPSLVVFAVDVQTRIGLAIKVVPVYQDAYYNAVAIPPVDAAQWSGRSDPLSFADLDALANIALHYESCVYTNVIPELHHTPHLVRPVGQLIVQPDQSALPHLLYDTLLGHGIVDPSVEDVTALHLIMTERVPSTVTLHQALIEASEEDIRSFLFQLVYTLHVLTANEVVHHDLHLRNILVDQSPAEAGFVYKVGGHRFQVPMGAGKLLLFDWDRAYAPRHCGDNPLLHHVACERQSACNSFSGKYDMTFVLGMVAMLVATNRVVKFRLRPEAMTFLTECLGDTYGVYHRKFRRNTLDPETFRPCHRPSGKLSGRCLPWPADDPPSVLSPSEALQLPYFDQFRVPLSA